ncbi:mono [ADP-ribose] polymerase PARP16-like isoform X1 [Limulus polyphemus]|uniref:Poly [ADP-ribose] polymerase n=2 Tax=Limulus polyphemus TaxID=6850 RepID=A0ABM1C4H3_LIMPO|nr:mono [ADP-ribose] polymerase PARP16-like isoform X1 [Limulus polyphemus]
MQIDKCMFSESKYRVLEQLQSDPLASDLLWSLFCAAVESYRHDSILRPFPSAFLDERTREKDVEHLRTVVSSIPSFQELIVNDNIQKTLPSESWDLLHWVLQTSSFRLCSVNSTDKFQNIKQLTHQVMSASAPTHVYEVCPTGSREQKFQKAKGEWKSLYAYHGSRIDNFFSILHNGLVSNLNKTSLFGTGTYLSSELTVALHYSPVGWSWKKSLHGSQISCVAVCEMIDHPDLKCQTKGGKSSSRSYSSDSLAGKVPEKYYLVQNDDLVRVRYLLVYTESPVKRKTCVNHPRSWWHQHKFFIMMMIYGVALLAIGLATSKQFHRFLQKLFL